MARDPSRHGRSSSAALRAPCPGRKVARPTPPRRDQSGPGSTPNFAVGTPCTRPFAGRARKTHRGEPPADLLTRSAGHQSDAHDVAKGRRGAWYGSPDLANTALIGGVRRVARGASTSRFGTGETAASTCQRADPWQRGAQGGAPRPSAHRRRGIAESSDAGGDSHIHMPTNHSIIVERDPVQIWE